MIPCLIPNIEQYVASLRVTKLSCNFYFVSSTYLCNFGASKYILIYEHLDFNCGDISSIEECTTLKEQKKCNTQHAKTNCQRTCGICVLPGKRKIKMKKKQLIDKRSLGL